MAWFLMYRTNKVKNFFRWRARLLKGSAVEDYYVFADEGTIHSKFALFVVTMYSKVTAHIRSVHDLY